jgi:triacylglycerol lipase
MPFDPAFTIKTTYPAANAAYLIMNVADPALPAGYTLVGPIDADTKQAAAAMSTAPPNQTRMASGMLAESNFFGLVAWNAAEQTAMVAFRGTKTIWDWVEDIDAAPVAYGPVSDTGLVHMGFALVYEHVRLSVGRLLMNGCKGAKRILVTGHSLGGAVAVLSALDILKNVPLEVTPELITLAGPRAGDPIFMGHLNSKIPTCFRVVNYMDLVPQVPIPPLYTHVGSEELVHGGFKVLDVTYAHHLTTYLAGLQKLLPVPPPPPTGIVAGPGLSA